MAKTSPTQRTLKHLRDQGYTCAIVEKFNSFIKIRQDLFGIIDIICLAPGSIIGVQSTGQDFYGHRSNMMNDKKKKEACEKWINAGGRLILYGWSYKTKGKRKIYEPKIQEFYISDFSGYNLTFG